MRKLLLAASAAAAIAAPAAATTYNFSMTGAFNATWSLPQTPTPSAVATGTFTVENVAIKSKPSNTVGNYSIWLQNSPAPSFVNIYGPYPSGNTSLFIGYGALFYTGSVMAPVFKTGTFSFNTGTATGPLSTLTITEQTAGAVPEPASWAMLIAGFGLTGAALRRRRVSVAAA